MTETFDHPVDVLAKLRDLRERFKRCAIHGGSDEESAEGACEQFDGAIDAVADLIHLRDQIRLAQSNGDSSISLWNKCMRHPAVTK